MTGSRAPLLRSVMNAFVAAAALAFATVAYVYVTLPDVRPLATVNPTTTAFMELREREAAAAGRTLPHEYRWIPYTRISPSLKRAVLVAEDDAFWEHEGVDLEQLREAVQSDLGRGRPMRGASTITQQLAKNLYLSPSRDPLRKLRELIIARRLEAALSKARILELYLNLIEWGDGIWGAEAASRRYFGVSASSLGPEQAALLAGAIINPRVLTPSHPSRRLLRRQSMIRARMGTVMPPAAVPVSRPAMEQLAPIPAEPPAEPPEELPGDPEPIPPPPSELPPDHPIPGARLRHDDPAPPHFGASG